VKMKNRENLSQVGVTCWHHWRADGSKLRKRPLILLKSQLFICEKKEPWLDCQWPTPTSLKSSFLLDICPK
jgi:hypothetical protein